MKDNTEVAAGFPRRDDDPVPDPAMGLHGKVFQEERVHRALEVDMKLSDLAFGKK